MGLAESATTLDIDEEGAVKKRDNDNDNDILHGVFDNEVDPSSLASILLTPRVTKQKEEEDGISVIIAATFVQFYCFCHQFVQFYPRFYSSSFFNVISFLLVCYRRERET